MPPDIFFTYKKHYKAKDTVLFLHGWGGSVKSFLHTEHYIGDKFNTINLDFYGFGESPSPPYAFGIFEYALSVYELLKSLNVEEVYIIAHSFGGRVAILLSSVFDIKVKGLMLISSAGIKPRRGLPYYVKVYSYKLCKKLVKLGVLNKKHLKRFGSSDYKALDDKMKETFLKVIHQNLADFLSNITVETYLLWGSKDKSTPMYFAKYFKRKIKNSKLFVFKGNGHFCYLENNFKFNKLLTQFLNY